MKKDKYSTDRQLTIKHKLTVCTMGRCCNAQIVDKHSSISDVAVNALLEGKETLIITQPSGKRVLFVGIKVGKQWRKTEFVTYLED